MCSVLTSMQSWAHNLRVEWGGPEGQTVHPRAESRTGFGLVPVSAAGEGVQVGGGVEQKQERL